MCGIAGVLRRDGEPDADLLEAMSDAVRHRGPDSAGSWSEQHVGLAHRRLAVVDLSPAGHQPMQSADGRWVITYNGEIYNHRELRAALMSEGIGFRGHSDTEVLLEAVSAWGVRNALRRCDGMFAIALWDRSSQRLTLARDRHGEKPLYAGWVGRDFLFASALSAFRRHPDWQGRLEPRAAGWMLGYGFVPAPWSIHRDVYKLQAGRLLEMSPRALDMPADAASFASRQSAFFDAAGEAAEARRVPWTGNVGEAVHELGRLLDRSVALRMAADVPVGAFLSGGIDSSLVVESMARQHTGQVDTYTVAFDSARHDESDRASATAAALGTRHHTLRMTAADVQALVADLPEIYDEPFADAAQLPAILMSRFARAGVTVALTGDAGDECFEGYQRHLDARANWRVLGLLPPGARSLVAGAGGRLSSALPPGALSRVLARQAGRIGVPDFEAYAAALLAFPGALRHPPDVTRDIAWPRRDDTRAGAGERLRLLDQALLLPEGIHTKLDRASMACALELRVPLLDPEIVRLSWRLPAAWHSGGGVGKRMLRSLARQRLPGALHGLPKRGFDVPLAAWLSGPLRGWVDHLLSRDACPAGVVDMQAARAMFRRHVDGRADHALALWSALMFLAWADRHA